MELDSIMRALIGGCLIGTASTVMYLLLGRIFGISGIIGGIFDDLKLQNLAWRLAVALGLLSAGCVVPFFVSNSFEAMDQVWYRYAIAGLIVGFGTQLGSGCTSGHGVCGISRLSVRSLVATLTFISAGIFTVLIVRTLT